MNEANDEIEVNYSITADSAPIIYRYMMASPPQLRRRRMTKLIPMACETVLRTLQFGGRMYSGGTLNPNEFASDGLDDPRWMNTSFLVNVYSNVTPILFNAVKDKPSDQVKTLITTCLETYLLTLGATTSVPADIQAQASPFVRATEASSDTDRGGVTESGGGAVSASDGEPSGARSESGKADDKAETDLGAGSSPTLDSESQASASSSNQASHPAEYSGSSEGEDSSSSKATEAQERMLERLRNNGVAR